MNALQDLPQRVTDFLCSIPALKDEDNRTGLLDGVPSADYIKRSSAIATDLSIIVGYVSDIAPANSGPFEGESPLLIMLENSRRFVKGTAKEAAIDGFKRELERFESGYEPTIFVNRIDEINKIDSPPVYYLIDAPDGYGKTWLLKELRQRFENAGWACAYVGIKVKTVLSSVIKNLAHELHVNNTCSTGKALGSAIISTRDLSKQGIVLLLDFEDEPDLAVFEGVIDRVIPDLYEILSKNPDATIPLRVVVAGRHLAMTEKYKKTQLPFAVVVPTLFDDSVVRDYVKKVSTGISNVNEIAADLTYLTGGHPASLVSACKIYQKQDWNYDNLLRLWLEKRDLVLEKIYTGLRFPDETERSFIAELSLFRRLDRWLLSQLPKPSDISDIKLSDLEDGLTKTYLFERQGSWIVNTVVRRMLVLWLQNKDEQNYANLCAEAIRLHLEGLKQARRDPEIWVVEYLFQCLQASTGAIDTPEQRAQVRSVFWQQNFQRVMCTYLEHESDVDFAKESLESRIEMDWEFKFMLNYYLRSGNYREDLYSELYNAIEKFDPRRQCPAS